MFKFNKKERESLYNQAIQQVSLVEDFINLLKASGDPLKKALYNMSDKEFDKFLNDAQQKVLLMSVQMIVLYNMVNKQPDLKTVYPEIIQPLLKRIYEKIKNDLADLKNKKLSIVKNPGIIPAAPVTGRFKSKKSNFKLVSKNKEFSKDEKEKTIN